MRERVLAIIGAIGLVCVALFVRSKLANDSGPSATHRGSSSRPTVACTSDLMAVCDALVEAGKVAPNPKALDLDATAEDIAAVDAWITWDPAPAIANASASQAGDPALWEQSRPLAAGHRSILLTASAHQTINQECNPTTWSCLAATAIAKLDNGAGVGDPATSEGLARIAPLARALAKDGDYLQLEADTLRDIVTSPPEGQSDATTMSSKMATANGYVSLVVGPEALLRRAAASDRGSTANLVVVTPRKASTMTVVVVPRRGVDLAGTGSWCRAAADSLTALGLEPCSGTPDDSLAGFLYQVRKKVD